MDDQERIRQLETQVATQQAQIEHLLGRLHELEGLLKEAQDRQKKESHNSRKPPSTDRFARAPKRPHSVRERSGKKPGGQEGHRGHSLQVSDAPDQIVAHSLTRCPCCQQDLSQTELVGVERRHVWEVPVPGIIVTEHQGERTWCPHCQQFQVAPFPKDVSAAVQSGPRRQALAVSVNQ